MNTSPLLRRSPVEEAAAASQARRAGQASPPAPGGRRPPPAPGNPAAPRADASPARSIRHAAPMTRGEALGIVRRLVAEAKKPRFIIRVLVPLGPTLEERFERVTATAARDDLLARLDKVTARPAA